MTFSSLISGTIPNHGKYNARPGKVTRVIEHHWGGVTGGIERLSNPTQKASATYLVLSDGRILGQVPEEFRPWTSGGAAADNSSITIECQNSTGAPDYKVSAAAFNSIVRLLADIATRHDFGSLTTTNYRGHREFAATACPGPYLWPRLQSIRDAANALPGGTILVGSHVPVPVHVTTPAPAPTAPAPLTVQEDDMRIIYQPERGTWLMGAGFAHHFGPEEWGQFKLYPHGLTVTTIPAGAVGQRVFDLHRTAYTKQS